MSGSVRQGSLTTRGSFRLSPNEEAAILKEERDRRRKLRLKQVREQDRLFAKQLLVRTKAKKEAEVKALSLKLEAEWKAVQTEKQEALKEIYQQCMSKVGDGHREARNQKPLDEERAAAALKNAKAAKQRHQAAILKESAEKNEKWQKENAHIISRKNALEVEKVRASHIANLPPPKRDPLADLDLQKPPVMVTRVEGFSTTHYHIPGEYVERAEPHEQGNAKLAAKEEGERLKEETEKLQAELRERQEKAVLRHKHAKEKELLKQDYERLLLELSDLQNADRRRRQAVVADIPRQVFQPPHRRLEDKAEKQHQLEEAFEDMYMKHTDYAGDITLALEPKVPGQDTDLDLTTETTGNMEDQDSEITLERPSLAQEDQVFTQYPTGSAKATLRQRPDESSLQQKTVSSRAEMLKRLMGRVRGQQDDWKKQQTKLQTPVASGHSRVIPESQEEDEEITTSPESGETESQTTTETTPTQALTTPTQPLTTPTELSEHPIESGETGSTISSMPRSLETGTLSEVSSETGSTLLHPMERAARLRGEQIAHQARTQEDIRAIGEEQQKRLDDLKHTVQMPWDNSRPFNFSSMPLERNQQPAVPHEQWHHQMANTDQGPQLEGFVGDRMQHVTEANFVPGVLVHPTPDTIPTTLAHRGAPAGNLPQTSARHLLTERKMDSVQTHGAVELQYETQGDKPIEHQPFSDQIGTGQLPVDDTDGMLLMQHRPKVAEERMAVQNSSSESHVSSDQSIDRQLLDEVVHDVSGTIPEEDSAIDWLKRAREYQQRLLERQKESQDSLLHAQMKLHERRERLIQNYPDVKLPDYVPYTFQNEISKTDWLPTGHFTETLTPSVGEHQDTRTLNRDGAANRYDTGFTIQPSSSRGQQTLSAHESPFMSSEEGASHRVNGHQVGYGETIQHMESRMESPSKRRLDFNQEPDQYTEGSQFAPMTEEAVSQTSAEESENLGIVRKSGLEDINVSYVHDTSEERKDTRKETEADKALRIRHQQLLEEKRILEERQHAQQLRLLQKQKELADQIEQQQRRYQERMKAAKVSPPSKGPPLQHSPSIPQGILRKSGVGSHPESSTGQFQSSSGVEFEGTESQHIDMRRMLQGQVFKPQDLLHHLQASQSFGVSEPEDESDVSQQSSSRTPGGTMERGNMMMGVLKPHELLPHLQTHFTDSEGSLQDNSPSSSSGLQEQSLRGTNSVGQNIQTFSGGHSHTEYMQTSGLSEGTLDMDSTASHSLQHTGSVGGNLFGQVFRPADLMAELKAINQQVGRQDSFEGPTDFTQSKSREWRPTIQSGTLSASEEFDTRSGLYQLSGSFHGQTTVGRLSTGVFSEGSQETSEFSGARKGPKGVYKELLQGHVFRPDDLLPHLQNPSLQSLDGSSLPEPHLSSTLQHADTHEYSYVQRPEGDGSGSEQLPQTFGQLSLTYDDDTIHAASPDLDDRVPIQNDQPPVPMFLPMAVGTHPAQGLQVTRSRRPPPANLHQVAMLPENMGPHELSTIIEMETSADERMHMLGVSATPRNVVSRSDEKAPHPNYLSGTEGNLGERLPTFGGPATVGESSQASQEIVMDRSGIEIQPGMQTPDKSRGDAASSVIQISQPFVAGMENELFTTPETRIPHLTSDLQARDVSVTATTLSEHTLEDESIADASDVDHHSDRQRRTLTGELHGSYGTDLNVRFLGVHRGEPAGQSMRWKDLLSDESAASSSSDGLDRGGMDTLQQSVPVGEDTNEFLPMLELENTTMATQDSIHDHSSEAKDGTGFQSHAESELGNIQMQKHLAAGLNLASSSSSNGQNNGSTPRLPSQEEFTPSSSSKLSTVIGAAMGEDSSGPPSDDNDSPLFVPKSSQHLEQFHFHGLGTQRSAHTERKEQVIIDTHDDRVLHSQDSVESSRSTSPGQMQSEPSTEVLRPYETKDHSAIGWRQGSLRDRDVRTAASQEEYIKDLLASLPHGRQRGITMPLFSDVSLSGYSMSQDGSVSEMRSPVKGRDMTSLQPNLGTSAQEQVHRQLTLAGASYPEDQTFPSLDDIQMETGILEEPELTFASSLNTTADSILQASRIAAPAGLEPQEHQEPSTLDLSQSSQASVSRSLLSFQQHEQELLESSPLASSRVTRSESHLKVTQSLTSTTHVRVTHSEGQVKGIHQSTSQQASVTESAGEFGVTRQSDSDGPISLGEPSGSHDRHTSVAASGSGPVSLQEAFQQRKKAFIQSSESRKKEIKDHAQTRSQESTAFAKTIQDWKRSKVKEQRKQATVKKAIKSKTDQSSTASSLSSTLKTRTDRNTVQKEMKERNLRLYNQLEEVKKQKAEKERQDSYAANRQKKKEYEQKLQAKRLKRTSSLEKTKKDK
ncbi:centrosomal protein of 295 kDa-like [Lytechinus variegatus]|uniref:centrosomal protein of 295 kDa-like n=1 Tax=Lytechinus variegatus TaxID=7654 RepID=UPI001BB20F1C|nr:centrosomal protein of 295 kDa-like [Lytechinus variegatus]XP_041483408.1 centrosomal protein of 295 kDa-like [Lytechinus variegatus]